ncbi:MAG: protein kinase domain-containing protein [Myxococcota bacterium]
MSALPSEVPKRYGRFEAQALLKEGLGIATWRGVDTASGEKVILKVASTQAISKGAAQRLTHEAHVLDEVRSPYLSPLLEFQQADQTLYLVTRYVEGIPLQERLRRSPLGMRESLAVGRCLLLGLDEAHAHGVLHRDLKPANVIVPDQAAIDRATLIDFGLARSAKLETSLRDIPVGTVRYLAPEQAGLMRRDIDERSDLYSLGVMLFECLAGRPPFDGQTASEVLRQHLVALPPPLREHAQVCRALEEVVLRLMQKEPKDRFQSAKAAEQDLAAIFQALERGESEPAMVIGLYDQRPTIAEPSFVGREEELTRFEAVLDQARAGRGGLVLLEAASGGGKSRLMEELALRTLRQGAVVLRGQAVDQTAQLPFQVLEGVCRALVDDQLSLLVAARPALVDHSSALSSLMPLLRPVLATGGEVDGPEIFGQERASAAVIALLNALGGAQQPVVIFLDDCQWADELTMRTLTQWNARTDPPKHVVVVAAFRSEEVAADAALRRAKPVAHLLPGPLTAGEVSRLAESMAGKLPAEALELLGRLCEGSPFLAGAVLKGLVEGGALVKDPEGWRIEQVAMDELRSSRQAAAFLTRRLARLSAPALRLLEVAAVLGKAFDSATAAALADMEASTTLAALDECRRLQLVWADAEGARYTFVHDKIREALLGQLSDEARRRLHQRAAAHLERSGRSFELAYHHFEGGHPERALPHAQKAAELARAQHALETAARYYQMAEAGMAGADVATRLQVTQGLGDVWMLLGRYGEAQGKLEAALELATGPVQRAQIQGKLGELAFKRGDMGAASRAIEGGLSLLGRQIPRSALGFLAGVVGQLLVQLLHSLFPRVFLGRRPLAGAEAELLAVRLFSRLAYAYWFERGTVETFWAHLNEMNRAERFPPTAELAQAYSNHSVVVSTVPLAQRGRDYAQRGLSIRKALGDVWGQGQSIHFWGLVEMADANLPNAEELLQEAERTLRRTGDRWEVSNALYNVAYCKFRRGALRDALELSHRVRREGVEVGDARACAIALEIWAKAAGGALPAELVREALSLPTDDVQTHVTVLQAEAIRLLAQGEVAQAESVLKDAERKVARAKTRNEWVSPISAWLLTTQRLLAQKAPATDPVGRGKALAVATRSAKRAMGWARAFRNNLPHVLRERGLLHAMRGQPRRAKALFDEAVLVANQLGARFEHAQCLLARGQVGLPLGWPSAARDVEEGMAALVALDGEWAIDFGSASKVAGRPLSAPTVPTFSLADRFDSVLECGRRIATSLSVQAVYLALHDGALTLLRGERCTVLTVDDQGQVFAAVGEGFSRALVQRALQTGKPEILAEGLSEDAGDSVLLSAARSALCCAFRVRGKPAGCFYITHQHVAGLFGEEESRLAEYLSALAGAALENAEGFTRLESLSRDLERRVRERTTELAQRNSELSRSMSQLRRTQDELVQAEKMAVVAKLAGGVAHELNNPLAFVQSNLNTLKRQAETWHRLWESSRMAARALERHPAGDAEGALHDLAPVLLAAEAELSDLEEVLPETLEGVQRISNLVSSFHRLADLRGPSGRLRVELASVVEEGLRGLPSYARAVVPRLDAGVEALVAPDDLRTAVINVLSYLSAKSRRLDDAQAPLTVRVEKGPYGAEVRINDPSLELTAEHRNRIFEPSVEPDGPTGQTMRLNVDLAVARQLARRSGAELHVEPATSGEGTLFRFVLDPMVESSQLRQ